jgi:hypothetical protein
VPRLAVNADEGGCSGLGCPRSAGVCWLAWMQSSEIWASSQPPPAAVGASSSLTISGMEVRSLCGLDRCESVAQRTGAGQCGDGEHWQTSGVWRGPSLLAAAAAALSFEFLGDTRPIDWTRFGPWRPARQVGCVIGYSVRLGAMQEGESANEWVDRPVCSGRRLK